jgi:hypothetical protein
MKRDPWSDWRGLVAMLAIVAVAMPLRGVTTGRL